MTCNKSPGTGRPRYVDCACGSRVEVGDRGAFPSRCAACRNDKHKRPLTVTCRDCPGTVKVGPRGGIPMRCDSCAKKANAAQTLKAKKKLLAERRQGKRKRAAEARDLGPEQPLRGMTPAQYVLWRDRRIAELCKQEGLPVSALAERFDVDAKVVRVALARAGVTVRTGEGHLLPAGLPVL